MCCVFGRVVVRYCMRRVNGAWSRVRAPFIFVLCAMGAHASSLLFLPARAASASRCFSVPPFVLVLEILLFAFY